MANSVVISWLKNHLILTLCVVVPFVVGGYLWGRSVEDDYRLRPSLDSSERQWSIIEAYGGGAILFGSVGALIYYISVAVVKKD